VSNAYGSANQTCASPRLAGSHSWQRRSDDSGRQNTAAPPAAVSARLAVVDGRVLSIRLDGAVYEVVAEGEPWSDTIKVPISPATKLPARFNSSSVEVSYFGGYFNLGGCRYKARGAVGHRANLPRS
jgi:hypothetical protein